MTSQSFQYLPHKGHGGNPEGLSPILFRSLRKLPPEPPGSPSPQRAELLWPEPRCRARVPTASLWAWAQLPLYLEELDSFRLQGLGGQGGEGGVQPVFAVAQHGVPPEGGVCPEHSTREQRQSEVCRERAPPHPHPHSDLQGRQGFQSGHTGCAAFTPTERGLGRCALHLFSTLRSTAYRKAALLMGLQ